MSRLCAFLFCLPAFAADWPQWRGPSRDGLSPETALLKSWPAGGPKQLWKTQGLGEGYSSFAVVQGRLYTQGQRGDQEFVYAFDAATGKKLWEVPAGGPFRERRGHGPRGTPTIDGDRLYALSADGTLVCLQPLTGKTVWTFNMVDKFRANPPHWGISESPLVDGDRLIVTPGGPGAAVVALDKKTGAMVWKSQSDPAAYSSTIAVDLDGRRQIIALTGEAAVGLSASNGELLWRYDKISNRTANIATPIFHQGHVFLSTDYGTGCALLKLSGGGSKEVYFNRDMRNHYSSSVLIGDYLYGFSSQVLTAMKFQTGEVAWRDRSVGKGSVTYADGHLYVVGETGTIGLVEATPQAYKEKSRFEIPRGEFPTWTPAVISGGRMFLREQDNLYCFDIQAR
ncbi:MAG: PQQ-like beta-propeller repeat protein [Candidatus Solibacter usitatus]|nr:PQQ-like beta-propeller repeat protein [Candidatus Solibacter usitatus]